MEGQEAQMMGSHQPNEQEPVSARSTASERLRLQEQISLMHNINTHRSHGSLAASGAVSSRSRASDESQGNRTNSTRGGGANGQEVPAKASDQGKVGSFKFKNGLAGSINWQPQSSGPQGSGGNKTMDSTFGVGMSTGPEGSRDEGQQKQGPQAEVAQGTAGPGDLGVQTHKDDGAPSIESSCRRLSFATAEDQRSLLELFISSVSKFCRYKDPAIKLRLAIKAAGTALNMKVEILFLENAQGLYVGSIDHGLPDGAGILIYSENDQSRREEYRGQFKWGSRHGIGSLRWSDGARYRGQWDKDKPSGSGIETYKDGSIYEGQFHEDCRHGLGEYRSVSSGTYAGSWDKGTRHGSGLRIMERTKTSNRDPQDSESEIVRCEYHKGKLVGKESGCRDEDLEEVIKQALDRATEEVEATRKLSRQLLTLDTIVDLFLHMDDSPISSSSSTPQLSLNHSGISSERFLDDSILPSAPALNKRPTLAKLPLSNLDTGPRKTTAEVGSASHGSPSSTVPLKTKASLAKLPLSPSNMVLDRPVMWLQVLLPMTRVTSQISFIPLLTTAVPQALQTNLITVKLYVRERDVDNLSAPSPKFLNQTSPQSSDPGSNHESTEEDVPSSTFLDSTLQQPEITAPGVSQESKGGLHEEQFVEASGIHLKKISSVRELVTGSSASVSRICITLLS